MSFGNAVEKAVDFIVAAQQQGQWKDYDLPVGVSTEWVTGFIGWTLADVGIHWQQNKAENAAHLAAQWLNEHRSYPIGWGYNAHTGPDSDSTACVIALMDALDYPVHHDDRQFLRDAWRETAGFTTYVEGDGAWSESHLDILWPALKSAQLDAPEKRWQSLHDRLHANFNSCTGWEGYWWSGPWYCTYHLLMASHWHGEKNRFIVTPEPGPLPVHSYSSAGWVAGSLMLSGHSSAGIELFQQIITKQRADGSWDSSPDLRVTNPAISIPDDSPQSGQLYADENRLMTTASILQALCSAPANTALA